MSSYTEFFLNTPSSVVQLELLEISHPNFTRTYYIVRNNTKGVEVTLENSTKQFFEYYPLRIEALTAKEDLDFGIRCTLGDLGEVLPTEVDAVMTANGIDTKPVVKYRTYRSDDLSAPIYGPETLEITSFSFDREGAMFDAKAPLLNVSKTGEVYTLDRFPPLRGLL